MNSLVFCLALLLSVPASAATTAAFCNKSIGFENRVQALSGLLDKAIRGQANLKKTFNSLQPWQKQLKKDVELSRWASLEVFAESIEVCTEVSQETECWGYDSYGRRRLRNSYDYDRGYGYAGVVSCRQAPYCKNFETRWTIFDGFEQAHEATEILENAAQDLRDAQAAYKKGNTPLALITLEDAKDRLDRTLSDLRALQSKANCAY